jgi:hypothetical protein
MMLIDSGVILFRSGSVQCVLGLVRVIQASAPAVAQQLPLWGRRQFDCESARRRARVPYEPVTGEQNRPGIAPEPTQEPQEPTPELPRRDRHPTDTRQARFWIDSHTILFDSGVILFHSGSVQCVLGSVPVIQASPPAVAQQCPLWGRRQFDCESERRRALVPYEPVTGENRPGIARDPAQKPPGTPRTNPSPPGATDTRQTPDKLDSEVILIRFRLIFFHAGSVQCVLGSVRVIQASAPAVAQQRPLRGRRQFDCESERRGARVPYEPVTGEQNRPGIAPDPTQKPPRTPKNKPQNPPDATNT